MTSPIESRQRGLTRESTWKEYVKEYGDTPFELRWGKGINLSEVLEVIGIDVDSIASVVEGVDNVAFTINALIETLEVIVDIVAIALGFATDAFSAFITALREVVTGILNLFTGLSISTLYHFPSSPKSRRTPDEILYDVANAYTDLEDGNRPVTVSDTSAVALLALWSLPNIEELLNVFGRLKSQIEGIGEDLFDGFTSTKYSAVTEVLDLDSVLKGGQGSAPDFNYKIDLLEFGAIKNLVVALTEAINGLSSAKSRLDAISEILELARRRVNIISNRVQAILDAINGIAQLFAFGDANAVLVLSGTGKDQDFSRALMNSVNHPNYPQSSLSNKVEDLLRDRGIVTDEKLRTGKEILYSGAVLLHVQAPNPTVNYENIVNMFKSFVKEVDQVEDTLDRAAERFPTSLIRTDVNRPDDYNANNFEA